MEYLDIVNEEGEPIGEIISRREAHEKGILHRTSHVWIIRTEEGRTELLLQKRSETREAYPGMYDTSAAGHIPAGEEPLESIIREMKEELGIQAIPDQLKYIGVFPIRYEKEFHGRMYRDNEINSVYVYEEPVEIDDLILQESEVSEVRWFDLDEVWKENGTENSRFCVRADSLKMLKEYLQKEKETGGDKV